MKQKPPHYELDHETRRIAEVVVEFAQELAEIQHSVEAKQGILDLTQELSRRLGIEPQPPEGRTLCEVIPLRPFRVIEPNNEEH